MQNSHALAIIQSLANGLDPETGRELPEGSPFEQPNVIRALFAAARALEADVQSETSTMPSAQLSACAPPSRATPQQEEVNAARPTPEAVPETEDVAPAASASVGALSTASYFEGRPANAGKPWNREEDARLGAGFERGVSLEVLAQIHARTLASIQSRLEKLGKIQPSSSSSA